MRLKHAEWIGKHIKVISSANPTFNNIEGTIVDETQNTITVDTERGLKKIQKHGTVFEIDGHRVVGDEVLASPVERIKVK